MSKLARAVSVGLDRRFPVCRAGGVTAQEYSLKSLGYKINDIASSVHSSRNTVSEVLTLAGNLHICWPFDDDVTNASLQAMFYPGRDKSDEDRLIPDYPKIHR